MLHHQMSLDLYERMMSAGVCREQAVGVLPQNLYTEYYGTVNLSNLLKFIDLRTHEGAQWEIQKVAEACLEIATDLFPKQSGLTEGLGAEMSEQCSYCECDPAIVIGGTNSDKVYYDESCYVCSLEINAVRSRGEACGIEFIDISSPDFNKDGNYDDEMIGEFDGSATVELKPSERCMKGWVLSEQFDFQGSR